MAVNTSPAANKSVKLDFLRLLSPYLTNTTDSDALQVRHALANLPGVVNRIDIFEDMFKPGLTGQIYFNDNLSISNLAQMRGLDFIELQFSMPDRATGDTITFGPHLFLAYNQSNRSPVGKATEAHVVGICSPEIVSSTSRKFSRSYFDKPEIIIQDIVAKPYGLQSKKVLTAETTRSKIKLVVPYLRPLEVIQLLTLQGQSAAQSSNYMFFETLEGYFYQSFRGLLERAEQNTQIPTVFMDLGGHSDIPNTRTRLKADQLQVITGYDILYAMSRGYFASTTIAPDVLSGTCGIQIAGTGFKDIDPSMPYDRRLTVNGPRGINIYPDEVGQMTPPTSRIFVVPTTAFSAANTQLTQKDPSITDNFIAQTLDARNRELLGLQSRAIRGVVSGAPHLHAGSFINVEFPTPLQNKAPDYRDIATGRYIIINAKHSIVTDGNGGFLYETTFEAVTDSLPETPV